MTAPATPTRTPSELLQIQTDTLERILQHEQNQTADNQAVIARLTQVIQFQTLQIAHLEKIARGANLYFWITIISIILYVAAIILGIVLNLSAIRTISQFL